MTRTPEQALGKSMKTQMHAASASKKNGRRRSATRSVINGVVIPKKRPKRRNGLGRIRKRKNGTRRKLKRNEKRKNGIQPKSAKNASNASVRSARRRKKESTSLNASA